MTAQPNTFLSAEKAEEEELGEIGKPRESEHECAYDGLSFKGTLTYDVRMTYNMYICHNTSFMTPHWL